MKLFSLTLVFLLAGCAVSAADELDDAYQNLQKAEADKDAAQVKKLAAETHALALQAINTPAPQDAEEKDAWTKHVAYAKDVDTRTEYALYATAVQSAPETLIDLIDALSNQNPKSKYLDMAWASYLGAMVKTGASAKVPAAAEKALANFPQNEELLAVLADNALTAKQLDRALSYSTRLVDALNAHGRPDGVAAADWQRRRDTLFGRGNWIAGVIHAERQSYAAANRELRAALPLISGNNAMLAPALFYLGVANYQLGRSTLNKKQVLEAADFSDKAARIEGPLAAQAWKNALACKANAAKMR